MKPDDFRLTPKFLTKQFCQSLAELISSLPLYPMNVQRINNDDENMFEIKSMRKDLIPSFLEAGPDPDIS